MNSSNLLKNGTTNSTSLPEEFGKLEWFISVISSLIFIIGIIGNYLVIHVVVKNSHMRTITNMFILNLAVGDFLVLLICLPPTTVQNVTFKWPFEEIMCKIIIYFQYISVCVSVLTLTAISYERFYAIVYPLKFKATKFRAKCIIFFIWFLSILACSPMPIVIKYSPIHHSCYPSWDIVYQNIFDISMASILYILPMLLISYTYTRVIKVLWKVDKSIVFDECENEKAQLKCKNDTFQSSSSMQNFSKNKFSLTLSSNNPSTITITNTITNSKIKNQLNNRRKAAKMLIWVAIMFAMCNLPIQFFNIIRSIKFFEKFLERVGTIFAQISVILLYANSCLNPLIYNFMSDNFRKEFKKILCCIGLLNKSASNVESLSKVIRNNKFSNNQGFVQAVKINNKIILNNIDNKSTVA